MISIIISAFCFINTSAYSQSPISKALSFDTTLQKFKGFDQKLNFVMEDTTRKDRAQIVLFVYTLTSKVFIKKYISTDSILIESPLLISDSKKIDLKCKNFFNRLFKYQDRFYDLRYAEKGPNFEHLGVVPKTQMWTIRAVRKYRPGASNFVFFGNISIHKYNIPKKQNELFIKDLNEFIQIVMNYTESKIHKGLNN